MSEDVQEEKKSGIRNSFAALLERVLESNKSANLLIIVLVILVAIPFLGIGIFVTRAGPPTEVPQSGN